MNNHQDDPRDSTSHDKHIEANRRQEIKRAQEPALGDLEPRAEIKGGSIPGIHNVTDITLKRGSGG